MRWFSQSRTWVHCVVHRLAGDVLRRLSPARSNLILCCSGSFLQSEMFWMCLHECVYLQWAFDCWRYFCFRVGAVSACPLRFALDILVLRNHPTNLSHPARWTWPGSVEICRTCRNLHQHAPEPSGTFWPEPVWAEDPISLCCWGKN